jgi:hypothetical protein
VRFAILTKKFRLGIERPSEQYLWPVKKAQEESEADPFSDKRLKLSENTVWKYFYSNGVEAPEEEDLAELSETVLYERYF